MSKTVQKNSPKQPKKTGIKIVQNSPKTVYQMPWVILNPQIQNLKLAGNTLHINPNETKRDWENH